MMVEMVEGEDNAKVSTRLRMRTRLSVLFGEKNLWGEYNVTELLKALILESPV